MQRCATNQVEPSMVPPMVHEVLRSSGQPLDMTTRAFMEPRFGQDFSRVRLHNDTRAAESAMAVNAPAYTVGRHIVFGAGEYSPKRFEDQLLMAHELTHVIQQSQKELSLPINLGSKSDALEQEASTASLGVLTNPANSPQISTGSDYKSGTLQGGWPLIAGIALGVGAGIYAIWAHRCLSPLERPMRTVTLGFRPWYCNRTGGPISNNVWDAFGHCWVACEATKRCGAITTALAGKGRDFWREYIDSNPHDSYQQDTNNQTLGRDFGTRDEDCTVSCQNAGLPGGAMDLTAPRVWLWSPSTGRYRAPASSPAP